MKKILPFIVLIALASCKEQLPSRVEMAANDIKKKTIIYYDTVTNDDAYIYLMSVSDTDDLLVLVNDENPVVRYYAFLGLYERNYQGIQAVNKGHQNDEQTIMVSNGACLKSSMPVNTLFADAISENSFYTYLFKNNKYRITTSN